MSDHLENHHPIYTWAGNAVDFGPVIGRDLVVRQPPMSASDEKRAGAATAELQMLRIKSDARQLLLQLPKQEAVELLQEICQEAMK